MLLVFRTIESEERKYRGSRAPGPSLCPSDIECSAAAGLRDMCLLAFDQIPKENAEIAAVRDSTKSSDEIVIFKFNHQMIKSTGGEYLGGQHRTPVSLYKNVI
ncbi:hypothetical protein ElyMa_003231200 [Elysia marginata]|uniref:Uncharacterized protein n=1 Tax=Elysia marginata TaxID=1093978 RepID=A0AAV4J619_9GAST|nr:hypothetical protein ElyMa_003231200 [Elysia marginata]